MSGRTSIQRLPADQNAVLGKRVLGKSTGFSETELMEPKRILATARKKANPQKKPTAKKTQVRSPQILSLLSTKQKKGERSK